MVPAITEIGTKYLESTEEGGNNSAWGCAEQGTTELAINTNEEFTG